MKSSTWAISRRLPKPAPTRCCRPREYYVQSRGERKWRGAPVEIAVSAAAGLANTMFKAGGKGSGGRPAERSSSRPPDVIDATDVGHLTGGVTPVRWTAECIGHGRRNMLMLRSFLVRSAGSPLTHDGCWPCMPDMLRRHFATPAMLEFVCRGIHTHRPRVTWRTVYIGCHPGP